MPELIPFRLTRDIVDGMGVAGTAGVFTRCCEETLHVLRENRQALLAVVDVSFLSIILALSLHINSSHEILCDHHYT